MKRLMSVAVAVMAMSTILWAGPVEVLEDFPKGTNGLPELSPYSTNVNAYMDGLTAGAAKATWVYVTNTAAGDFTGWDATNKAYAWAYTRMINARRRGAWTDEERDAALVATHMEAWYAWALPKSELAAVKAAGWTKLGVSLPKQWLFYRLADMGEPEQVLRWNLPALFTTNEIEWVAGDGARPWKDRYLKAVGDACEGRAPQVQYDILAEQILKWERGVRPGQGPKCGADIMATLEGMLEGKARRLGLYSGISTNGLGSE